MLRSMGVLCYGLFFCVSVWEFLVLFWFFFPITAGGVDSGDRGSRYTSIFNLIGLS